MENGGRGRLRRLARATASRTVGALGYELVAKSYYSPIPDLGALPGDIWTRRSGLAGVRFDERDSLDFVTRELGEHIREYAPPQHATSDPRDYHLDNGFYEGIDAETLYAMIRRYAPRRIVELGSGMSTLVIADARARNGDDGSRHLVFDPYPRDDLAPVLDAVAELRRVSATEVAQEEFDALGPGDLLFVDTTHTVRIAGDVNRVILEILPRLAPGVLVHVHDIYLPWEYPREFLTERRFFWAEQYLLQAFLAFNDEFRTLFSTQVLKRAFPEETARLIPSAPESRRPSAWWLQRVEAGAG